MFSILPTDEEQKERDIQRLQKTLSQAYDEMDAKVVGVDIHKYEFPFENLVFEGGGNKGLAYCGAVRVS